MKCRTSSHGHRLETFLVSPTQHNSQRWSYHNILSITTGKVLFVSSTVRIISGSLIITPMAHSDDDDDDESFFVNPPPSPSLFNPPRSTLAIYPLLIL